jgi:hypothetical protein
MRHKGTFLCGRVARDCEGFFEKKIRKIPGELVPERVDGTRATPRSGMKKKAGAFLSPPTKSPSRQPISA